VDVVAMDLKPASSTGDRDFEKEHREFLKVAIQKEVFLKTVITPETTLEDFKVCVQLVADVNPKLPFILQPLSATFGIDQTSLTLIETQFFAEAKKSLFDVRVIPQLHKIWGVR
jgi:7-carboxy-7-deazaguanine synthase